MAKVAAYLSDDPKLKQLSPRDEEEFLFKLSKEWVGIHPKLSPAPHRYCAYETLRTDRALLVVDKMGATRQCEKMEDVMADHLGLVKPCKKTDKSYTLLQERVQHRLEQITKHGKKNRQ